MVGDRFIFLPGITNGAVIIRGTSHLEVVTTVWVDTSHKGSFKDKHNNWHYNESNMIKVGEAK